MKERARPKVVWILGRSYCGSSLVNLILGAHPQVHGGGELYRLLANPAETWCRACGKECRYWTAERKAALGAATLYDQVAALFGRAVVVDSSKHQFAYVEAHMEGLACVRVLLFKHPIRHLASHVENSYLRGAGRGADGIMDYSRGIAKSLLGYYRDVIEGARTPLLLKYEDVVADPRRALAPALARLGLDWHPAMETFWSAEQHPIGGNAATHAQLVRSLRPASPRRLARMSESRRKFYAAPPGRRLDNKYTDVFSKKQISTLLGEPDVLRLCELLGYEHEPAVA